MAQKAWAPVTERMQHRRAWLPLRPARGFRPVFCNDMGGGLLSPSDDGGLAARG